MLKRLAAALFVLAVMCGTSWGVDSTYNPYYLYPYYVDDGDEWTSYVYNRFGNTDFGFLYQLRDITGASRSDQVAGPQWFATVYENYYYYFHNPDDDTHAGMYRRTMGGETPTVPFSVVGDVIDGFNFVHAEEPQPYESWMRRGIVSTSYYDPYPDPVESLCLVLTDGQGQFSVRFANPYARHFPFWWGWGTDTTANPNWWNYYDWREYGYTTADPIKYIVTGNKILERGTDRRYTEKYFYTVSTDASGDVTARVITDTAGATVYTLSGDIDSYHEFYDTDDELAYVVSGDSIYDASGTRVFTKETTEAADGADWYICEVRNVNESIAFDGFNNWTFTPATTQEQAVASGSYLDATFRARATDPYTYGSELGYIAFRQRASFASGYNNYREVTTLPIVVANVSNGNASTNPLNFDMIVFNYSGDVVNRIKFTWDAQNDMPDQDLGTFFMMTPYNSSARPYNLETRITNNTGTRYELFRYDQYGATRYTSPDVEYRQNYASIRPAHWKYNLTQDMYGTLPDTFMLDAHSQIAPGLVTVYKSDVYGTIDLNYDASESFRLYEYASPAPKNLRLNYKRVGGMTTAGAPVSLSNDIAAVQGFSMQFVDVVRNDEETAYEIQNLTGKAPAMVAAEDSAVIPTNTYIGSTALNSFRLIKGVPEALQLIVSYDEVVSAEPEPEPTEPEPTEPEPTEPEPTEPEPTEQEQTETASVRAAVTYTTDKVALQPVSIRLRLPRQNQLLVNRWADLDSATSARDLFNKFANFGTVWVRSSATREYDANLFTAINNKGANTGVSAADCVRAFIYNDELYLDFIILMADATSKNTGRTAFVEVFKDDGIPYVMIGDGLIDKHWDLSFYVAANASNPETRPDDSTTNNGSGNSTNTNTNTNTNSGGDVGEGGGGGGCNLGLAGMMGALMLVGMVKRYR